MNRFKLFPFNWQEKLRYAISMLLSKWINRNGHLHPFNPNQILVIREDEIGDMCYSMHVFEMLTSQYPHAQVTVLCKPFVQSLLMGNPHIHTLTSSYTELKPSYDVIVDLRGSWRSLLFAFKHKPSVRLDRATVRFRNKQMGQHPHEVVTNTQIVTPILQESLIGIEPKLFPLEQHLKKAKAFVEANQLGSFAIFHTGARKQLRKWNGFASLASILKERYQLDIVFTGDASEVVEINNWQQQIPFKTYTIAGNFDLLELAALCKLATIYIGNESGPLHIAAISGLPTVGLFGPGEPIVFYPWGKNSRVVHHVLTCNPCNQVNCVQTIPCIQLISVAEVVHEVQQLLA
ncbi:MAG: glycosyltransferase family 9 protein [Bacteroidia bacterium]|nr:glycosyltransferase family 9 protein [Bacteroidia bacterium]